MSQAVRRAPFDRPLPVSPVWLLLGAALLLLLIHRLTAEFAFFPEWLNLGLRQPFDQFQRWVVANRTTHWLFAYGFGPLSRVVDRLIRLTESFLLWLPWPVLVAAVFLTARRIANLRVALITTVSTLLMGLLGLWEESMATLALMIVSVAIALALGIPLGIWTARSDRVERLLRPLLDAMQTMPAFVYLIPVILFFGVARVPSLIATVIYALPPAIRFTNLGLRSVPEEALEAARSFGSTDRQILFKVQLPLALPTIMAGVNQVIMMALGIVVIAALIGGGGLGDVVLKALRRLRVGRAMEAGLAIVFMAILLDRLSFALSQMDRRRTRHPGAFALFPDRWGRFEPIAVIEIFLDRLSELLAWPVRRLEAAGWFGRGAYWLVAAVLLLLLAVGSFALSESTPARFGGGTVWSGPLIDFPEEWNLALSRPVDAAVRWAQVNLYEFARIGSWSFGTGPLSDFITLFVLKPLTRLLTTGLSWPVVMLLALAAAVSAAGRRLAIGAAIGLVFIGALGMWEDAMETLAQVIVAVALSIALGIPLGIWSARSPLVENLLRPVLDFLQTIPPFVYLVPVIMLFNTGSVPGIIASVLYAIPPVIRLTGLGIRQVDQAAVEAAESFGSTEGQLLRKVQLPLALPSIMLGVNQTVMMVLAMVIIAGLIGGGGLGYEVVYGLAQNELGRGVEAGIAIVVMAVIIDRLTQGWAERQREAVNL